MITEILVFILTTVVTYVLYTYKKRCWYFESRDVKYSPGLPIWGNTWRSMFGKRHYIYDLIEVYNKFPGERYVGFVEGSDQVLMIRDPELIKAITVKDFDHFVDHRHFFADQIFEDSLFQLKGDKWRDMRVTLSPAFTGSKMRLMVPFMNDICSNIVEFLKENEGKEIDIEDCIRRYTNDVIASTAFGLQVNSLKDKENEFYKTGQCLMVFSTYQKLKMMFFLISPVMRKFIKIFPQRVTDFFRDIVKNTMAYRESNKIDRPDMIQILMEAAKGTLKSSSAAADEDVGFAATEEANIKPAREIRHWTQDELVAQAFLFFIAGFDSTATALVLAVHEMALRPAVQDKLHEEVRAFRDKHQTISYDQLHKMKYLDAVVNESLRMWSPAIFLDRVCQKEYTLPPPHEGGKPYLVKKGDIVYNMVNAIHLDPEYFPDPHTFDPERFSDRNRHSIKPFTFMPFGSGPRNCIASRFALLELKVFLYHLLLNFRIVKSEKTTDPVTLRPDGFNLRALGGSWVKTVARN